MTADAVATRRGRPTTLGALVDVTPPSLHAHLLGDPSVVATGMTHDSRLVEAGDLFACIRGANVDGHDLAGVAVGAGAIALLVDHPVDEPVAQLVVDDTRRAVGPIAAALHDHPSSAIAVVGITGTNGKTTTTHLLASILRAAGWPTDVIGTLSGRHTTPEAPELQARLDGFRAAGDRAVVMEVSSHALAMHRVDGTRFAAAVFTNLGADHLDLHGTPEEYFRAKASLFTPELAAIGVTNVDDAHGLLLLDAATIEMVPFSLADVDDLEVTADHHAFTWRGRRITVGLGGSFNVANSLAAATTAAVLGVDLDAIVAGLAAADAVPGRFERILPLGVEPVDVIVIVDYAHTPDGLEQVILAARGVTDGEVTVVFGAGGDRDHAKRPRMGAVAAELADHVVVTSDNPRSEPPDAIISDVMAGVAAGARAHVVVEPDRVAAIARAVEAARPGDVVVVAGKGHETTQTIADRIIDLDDRAVVRDLLTKRAAR
ncbi:MAG: UDP-N-acetylmuramoyl-L-alanyl-D-glutamate--2,6-diaminopimelate ligase [Ilumatobacteraceae bacterium]